MLIMFTKTPFVTFTGVKALMTVALEGFKNSADLQSLEFGRGIHYKQLLSIGMQNVGSVMQKQIVSQFKHPNNRPNNVTLRESDHGHEEWLCISQF